MIIGMPKPFIDSSIVGLMESDFTFVPLHYQIHNGKISTNIDAILLTGEDNPPLDEVNELNSLGVPVLGLNRISKLDQHCFFTRHGINCPDYYYTRTSQKYQLPALLENVEDETQMIVKSMFGARGLQQFLIKKGALIKCAQGDVPAEEVSFQKTVKSKKLEAYRPDDIKAAEPIQVQSKDKAVLGGGHDDEMDESRTFFRNSPDCWLITKRVFLRNEYRVLIFGGEKADPLYCERHINLDHFQNNLAVGAKVTYYGAYPEGKIETRVIKRIDDYAQILRESFPMAYALSMDIYVDSDNNVGLFEFSGEFGFKAVNLDDLRKRLVSAISYLIRRRDT
jgi:hypothetical protein